MFEFLVLKKILKFSPDKGLEPLTSGLKVPRSTDWANRAYVKKAN